eukprot:GEMP01039017.1.p1 GENE.GEMP01039017.1~~GEMP01039017.1.p1  ORF type:complete len:299 (+),score=58.34 GEMP01039017.1:76-972(+)
MPRHSKNAADRVYMTNYEINQTAFNFTQEERIGTDSHLPFGYCCLSMKAPAEPVVTPEGYIYDRDFIVQYMAETKKALIEKKEEYEADQRRKEAVEKLDEAKQQLKALEQFDSTEHGVLKAGGAINRRETFSGVDKADCRKKNFWMASEAPTSEPSAKEKVMDLTVRCPMSGKKLRMKDLFPVEFHVISQEAQRKGGERGMYCCEVSKRTLTVQPAYYLKPSRKVVEETVLKKIIKPTMTCPITDKKLKDSDIIKLRSQGTGFSAHNDVLVKRHRHLVSTRECMPERSGLLGLKGTCR